MSRGLMASIVYLAVVTIAAAEASANDYHSGGACASCAAPTVTYYQQPCGCCRPKKKNCFAKLWDAEQRKNKWLLDSVKRCFGGKKRDCCHCYSAPQPCCQAPQPTCHAPTPCCEAPQPTCAAPQPTCAAPAASCGCGH